jgi:hypothetical protein
MFFHHSKFNTAKALHVYATRTIEMGDVSQKHCVSESANALFVSLMEDFYLHGLGLGISDYTYLLGCSSIIQSLILPRHFMFMQQEPKKLEMYCRNIV